MIRIPNDSTADLVLSSPDRRMWPSRVFASVVALANTAASGFFAVGGLVAPGFLVPGGDAPAPRVFAMYVAARGVALLGALVLAVVLRWWKRLPILLVLNGVVQAVDAGLGVVQADPARVIGPAIFAAALFGAAGWLSRDNRSVRAA